MVRAGRALGQASIRVEHGCFCSCAGVPGQRTPAAGSLADVRATAAVAACMCA